MIEQSEQKLEILAQFSFNQYKEEIISIEQYIKKQKSNNRKWFELIYCILVGTQIKTTLVQKCFNDLIEKHYYDLHPDSLNSINSYENLQNKIQTTLMDSGYRFHKTKTITIMNAISYFKKINFDIDTFLQKFNNIDDLRNNLMEIKGIGLKIASHWLRNLGYNLPVIDIHVKNLLYRFGAIPNLELDYKDYERIQNSLSIHLKINPFELDLAFWIFGRENCGKKKCILCKFRGNCANP